MGPSADRDSAMVSPHNGISGSSGEGSSSPDLLEKYRSLKRRYDQLEEESNSETRSSERNVRMREEREYLLQKMRELESEAAAHLNMNGHDDVLSPVYAAQSSSSDSSRIVNSHACAMQESNLRQALGTDSSSHLYSRQIDSQSQRNADASGRDGEVDDARSNGLTRGSMAAEDAQRSPRRSYPQGDQRQSSRPEGHETSHSHATDGDVEMADGHGTGHTNGVGEPSPGRRDGRLRLNGTDIAAIAAAAVAASAGISTSTLAGADHASSSTQHAPPMSDHARSSPANQHASLSTLANALGTDTESLSSKDANSSSSASQYQETSVEGSAKVAEPPITDSDAINSATTSSSSDPNLDPTLSSNASKSSPTPASKSPNDASSSVNKPSNIDTGVVDSSSANASASSSSATPSSASSTPSSSLSSNPYLSLSTNLIQRAGSSASPPTAHPMFMPYFFYPPATPSPNSPSYPMAYNPYYYLVPPLIPGPNGVYPPPANATPSPQQRSPQEPQKAKTKRLKAHTVTTKNISIPMVPRDKKGKPMLPLNVGIMTVISLGEVCMRDHFHTERYIFPVGYEVTRRYLSTIDPTREVVYHCTILDGGDGPKFQIIPSDRPDKPIIAGTATGAWSSIVKQANAIRNRQHSNSVSGPDFFGLGQNTIKHLIQELPNADRLRDYVWQNFVEGGPLGGRHAAVIPALPDEYDSSMPIGAYYPKRDENPNPNLPRGLAHYPQHIIAQAEAQRAQKLVQEEGVTAGPSGSVPTPTPPPNGQIGPGVPPLDPQILAATAPVAGPSQPPQAQPISQGMDRRATRSSTAATSVAPTTVPQDQQPPPLAAPVNGAPLPPGISSDAMPTTFAEIMNAYPVPPPTAPNIPALPPDAAQASS